MARLLMRRVLKESSVKYLSIEQYSVDSRPEGKACKPGRPPAPLVSSPATSRSARGVLRGLHCLQHSKLHYLCTATSDPQADATIRWNDAGLDIDWPISAPVLLAKYAAAPFLADIAADRLPSYES